MSKNQWGVSLWLGFLGGGGLDEGCLLQIEQLNLLMLPPRRFFLGGDEFLFFFNGTLQ